MKHLKKFNELYSLHNGVKINESIEDFTSLLLNSITEDYPSAEVNQHNNEIDVVVMDIEPEEGSYVQRLDANIKYKQDGDSIIIDLALVAGQYGCDEYEEESGFEAEFDYDVSATHFSKRRRFTSLEESIDWIKEMVSNYY